MARKKAHAPHINHERWMVSYADFVTLLFALFVLLFSMSSLDVKKYDILVKSLQQAFGVMPGSISVLPNPVAGDPDNPSIIPPVIPLPAQYGMLKQKIEARLEKEGLKNAVNVNFEDRGMVISLKDTAFFDSGSDQLKKTAFPALVAIAQELEKMNNRLRVEGHTDNVPINTAQFPSNWELSAARASSMLRFLLIHTKIPADRYSIGGYGQYYPIASNGTAEGRAKNRRVDIVILNPKAAEQEPLYNKSGTNKPVAIKSEGAPATHETLHQ